MQIDLLKICEFYAESYTISIDELGVKSPRFSIPQKIMCRNMQDFVFYRKIYRSIYFKLIHTTHELHIALHSQTRSCYVIPLTYRHFLSHVCKIHSPILLEKKPTPESMHNKPTLPFPLCYTQLCCLLRR